MTAYTDSGGKADPMIRVGVDEFVSARGVARSFSNLTQRLRNGELQKAVIVWRNKPGAVLLSIEAYAALVDAHDEGAQ